MGRPPIPEASRKRLAIVADKLVGLLPASWDVATVRRSRDGGDIELTAPDGSTGAVAVIVRRRLEPRDAAKLPLPDGRAVVFADWLSPRAREVLLDRGANFIDGTGNADTVRGGGHRAEGSVGSKEGMGGREP